MLMLRNGVHFDIQEIAIGGKFGRQSGVLEPFKTLSVDQLQQVKQKKEAEAVLTDALKGVQRVPSILITNPTINPTDLHLQHCTILGSEPLHDLKGHLSNVFTELPYLLKGGIKEECEQIIKYNTRKEKSIMRRFSFDSNSNISQAPTKAISNRSNTPLMETAVRISDILYLYASARSPKRVLELYNCTWLLCTPHTL